MMIELLECIKEKPVTRKIVTGLRKDRALENMYQRKLDKFVGMFIKKTKVYNSNGKPVTLWYSDEQNNYIVIVFATPKGKRTVFTTEYEIKNAYIKINKGFLLNNDLWEPKNNFTIQEDQLIKWF